MERQQTYIAQAVTLALHINRTSGKCASVELGGSAHEISVLVLTETRVEPLYSRTVLLARPDDNQFAFTRAARDLAQLVDHLQQIAANSTPRGVA